VGIPLPLDYFLSCSDMLERHLGIGSAVSLSDFQCPSVTSWYHVKTDARIGSHGFHQQVAQVQLSYPRSHGNPLARASNETDVNKNGEKNGDFLD